MPPCPGVLVTSPYTRLYCYAATYLGSVAVFCCRCLWLREFIHCCVIFSGCHGTVTHGGIAACDWRGTVACCYPTTLYYLQLGSTSHGEVRVCALPSSFWPSACRCVGWQPGQSDGKGGGVVGRAGVGRVSLYCVGVLSQAWEDKAEAKSQKEGSRLGWVWSRLDWGKEGRHTTFLRVWRVG